MEVWTRMRQKVARWGHLEVKPVGPGVSGGEHAAVPRGGGGGSCLKASSLFQAASCSFVPCHYQEALPQPRVSGPQVHPSLALQMGVQATPRSTKPGPSLMARPASC